ncbi:MAG TPA: hypothetical protein VEV63_11780 [Streptosporangiaceae bacterium]|nr:hypothetical protein [Streptosporangiaceae bacterium]
MTSGTIFLLILTIIVFAALGGTVLRTMVRKLKPGRHRVQRLSLRELSNEDRERYSAQWVRVQERFGETPSEAVAEAQSLADAVMRQRVRPVAGHEQAVADLSVDHARVLDRFRSAHAISEKAASGQISTEDVRTAMLRYRELFDQLLGTEETTAERRSGARTLS